jgi:hypothetical protein
MLAAAVLAVGVLGGCGGEGPTRNDAETVKLMLSSSAAVQQAFGELYGCLPERPACYTRNGPTAVTVVESQRERFAAALRETDNECLRDVGDLYLASLDSYADAAEAAADAKPAAFDAAISRTTDSEIAYNQRLTQCGFTEGRSAEIGAAIREVNIELLRLSEEIGECLRPQCIRDVAQRMEDSSAEGVSLLEDYRDELGNAPDCLVAAVDTFLESFRTLGSAARALQAADFATAERDGSRAGQLAVDAQNDMAACLSSLGA